MEEMKVVKPMRPMKDVLFIVLHCTSTKLSHKLVTVEDLDNWHKGRNMAMIGYHWYVDRTGQIFPGRPEHFEGAHVKHYNDHAIGVCYEGGIDEKGRYADTRTAEQKAALWFLLKDLKEAYPKAKIMGHRDFPNVHKECPCLDTQTVYAALNSPQKTN